ELGYNGGYSILREYVRTLKPRADKRPTTVIEHPPGKEGQVDWSPYSVSLGGMTTLVSAFSFVLPFSRYMFVRFALDTTHETLVRLHEEAFAEFGAVPHIMTYDNMTTVGRHIDGEQVLNAAFAAYATRMDFVVQLTRPRKPNDHASVERPFHYVEHNCLRRRRFTFADLDDLNAHARDWCARVANVRTHGTTRVRPCDQLVHERPYLKAHPNAAVEPYEAIDREVQRDFCVRVDNNRYSTDPKLVREPVSVRLYRTRVEIWHRGAQHCVHVRATGRDQRSVLPEHEAAFKSLAPSRLLLEQAFLRLGDNARPFYEALKTQKGHAAGYHIQRLLRLADRHGAEVVAGAMAQAARYGNYDAETVARLIAGRASQRQRPMPNYPLATPEGRGQWLAGLDVESRDLADFDKLIDPDGEDTT
ncbi:MAG: IS21 family transposase, partial [Proteobacteria bacterium]|nr:IS21 family transposase [Pseudomonadota bacterium]